MTRSQLTLPALPYDDWEESKATLHLATQIMGKIKLARHPKLSHWWHATLRMTPRGISTLAVPVPGGSFEIELDIHDLTWNVSSSDGRRTGFRLDGLSIAGVYERAMDALGSLGHATAILDRPYDMPHSDVPFSEDEQHAIWDRDAIGAWWQAMLFVDEVFNTFAGRSFARTSPVQLFWHSFDIAVTRFTGRRAPSFGEGDRRSDVEAYSHEVISFGFWPGDPTVRFPAFYSYTAPEPEALTSRVLMPSTAWWQELPNSHMALLKYEDVRTAEDPREALLSFMESAYLAGTSAIGLDSAEELPTRPLWDRLDARFPLTRGREVR